MSDMMNYLSRGWIKLNRFIINSRTYDNPKALATYVHCLLRANICETRVKGIDLKPGQFVMSNDSLAEECGMSPKQMRCALEMLKSDELIRIDPIPSRANILADNRADNRANKSKKSGRVVTIVNYGFDGNLDVIQGRYQGKEQGNKPGKQQGNSIINIIENKEKEKDGGGGNTIQYSAAFMTTTTKCGLNPIPDYISDLVQKYGEEIVLQAVSNADEYSTPDNDKRNKGYITKACEGIAAGRDDRLKEDLGANLLRDETIEDWD